ncbi:branched-chain amino acid ABC transporter permease [Microvirga antarctica]|uniref:branched-chain amino acid ABC transporter permease n=1 Tax=Microvirga antarctica TaxID=2819233 RepID=UPI001B30E7DF|nr:branched-chain amino acid ABC transporter permease [Microvirga antarctica]
MSDILYFVILGIMTGSLYGLLGLGMNVIFSVLRFVNISHGDMLTVGAYVGVALAFAGLQSPWYSMAIGVGAVALLGLVIARVLLAPITTEGRVNEQRGMVVTLGLSLVIPNLILEIFGPDYQRVPGQFMTGVVEFGDLIIEKQRLAILVGSFLIAGALMVFLRYTRLGRAIRAVGENPEAAQASGISVRRIHLLTFTLGTMLAGAAGALVTPVTYAFPAMGLNYTLYSIAVVIIGGLGSVWGAIVAGLLLGIAESLSVIWMASGYNALVAPMMMLIMLIVRPQGLFGSKAARA